MTVTPTFIGLSAPAITYGTATTTISGQLNSNVTGQTIPAGETVQVTLNGVTQNAALDSNDNFSTTFNTSTLGASGSPYTIDFNYAGDATFSAATGSSTLTVNPIHTTFTVGDVFVSIGNGQVQWRLPDGTINETLDTGLGSGIYTAGMAFDSANNLYVTDFNGQAVSEFNDHGVLLGTFGSGYNSDPESILIDSSGNIYVGQADSSRQVLKFDPTGKLLASYSPQTEDRGTDWIDLASDQHTLYYTSEGTSIKRFDVATNTQLPDLATNLPGGSAYAHRLLSDGTTLVANSSEVVRLDASGNIIQTYAPPGGGSTLFGLNLDPDGTSFWTADLANSNVYKFDIATGKLLESYNGGSGTTVAGLAVFGELTAARSADVVLTQSVSPNTSVSVGTNLTYTLTVTNNGPDKSSAVSLQDTLPSNTSFVSATGTYTLANGVVTWNLGDLAANGNVSVTLVVNTTAVGTADNEAVVSSNTPDPDKSNNTSGLQTSVVNQQATITGVSITWGSQTAALQTASDGVRLLPAGRQTDIPWVNVQQITITLSTAASLGSGDISVSGQVAGNYGPVTLSGSGTQYTITLAKPISAADLVTVTIGNASIASYTRRMDVLPGDINDDGVVNVTDGTFILKNPTPAHPYNVFYDMNGDGAVNTTDFNLYRPYIGTVLPTLDAQLATGTLTAGGVSNLTSSELAPVLAAAIREWASAGLPAAEVARLRGITAQVANLPAGYLGEAVLDGNTIYLSPNAAGYGWYINTASSSFAAIGRRLAPTEFLASPPSPASGHEDLLTVVMHELGHTLGLGDLNPSLVPADLMAETLATGVRRLPSRQDVAWVSAHAAAATLAASANTMSAADVVFARIGNRASSSAPAAVFPPSSAGSLTQLARTSLLFSLFPAASLLDKTLDERPGAYPAVAAAPVIPIGRASFLQMALGFLGSDPWKQSNSWTTDSSAAEV